MVTASVPYKTIVVLGKCCVLHCALFKTSSRDSSTSISGSWGLTATPSPSRCRRPATLFSKTSRSSSEAASGPSAALKIGFSWLLSGTCTIVLRYKITIIWGQRDRYSYLYCCLWAQDHPDLFINGNNYKVISGINRNFKHLFGSLHSKGRSFTNIINGYSEILRRLILAVQYQQRLSQKPKFVFFFWSLPLKRGSTQKWKLVTS